MSSKACVYVYRSNKSRHWLAHVSIHQYTSRACALALSPDEQSRDLSLPAGCTCCSVVFCVKFVRTFNVGESCHLPRSIVANFDAAACSHAGRLLCRLLFSAYLRHPLGPGCELLKDTKCMLFRSVHLTSKKIIKHIEENRAMLPKMPHKQNASIWVWYACAWGGEREVGPCRLPCAH